MWSAPLIPQRKRMSPEDQALSSAEATANSKQEIRFESRRPIWGLPQPLARCHKALGDKTTLLLQCMALSVAVSHRHSDGALCRSQAFKIGSWQPNLFSATRDSWNWTDSRE